MNHCWVYVVALAVVAERWGGVRQVVQVVQKQPFETQPMVMRSLG
ncbi:hypothetical protein AVDCRST_MAG94-3412 [uncultured Leptolyngbya sp.]|uniref:Uncharacterized protein n=1 Tax=uncultured Leptolyngbya sp. TaxID=332963 RepID=A0A6J4MQG5_9CYAN|nr:hypothetical protein AVDCRST_MAG94-3412 [uncultured Leptolyngbya sp.]